MRALFLSFLFAASISHADVAHVHSDRIDPKFETQLSKALKVLADTNNQMSKETLRSLKDGRVKIGSFLEFTKDDFLQMIKDFRDAHAKLSFNENDYVKLEEKDLNFEAKLDNLLDGYAWGDRIYVSRRLTPKAFASTIVHEMNHVLNQSEKHYYDNVEDALMEEFRAYYVEALFAESDVTNPAQLKKIKQSAFDDIGEAAANLSLDVLPSVPTGLLYPSPQNWRVHWGN